MADNALPSSSDLACPVIAFITSDFVQQALAQAGYRRVERSRLGDQAEHVSLWQGRNLFVILVGQRVVIGPVDSDAWRLRTTLRDLDAATMQLLRQDAPSAPPEGEARESGTWEIARGGGQ